MMRGYHIIYSLLCTSLLIGCASKEKREQKIIVSNALSITRQNETIELNKELLQVTTLQGIALKNVKTNTLEVTQLVDLDGDGTMDQLLFQPTVPANGQSEYIVTKSNEQPTSVDYCYSRFVPERIDDYTWENDRVAFRVYGPTAQKMIEDNVKGGTLSSGVDAWLKRVSYPVIDKWYEETTSGKGSYHEDTGEGLDNFHVGVSRGVGGIAVKSGDAFYYSKNYVKWRRITTGPLRTSFELTYGDWNTDNSIIKESKIISLDKGSNLSKFTTSIEGTSTIYAGLTLHEKDGVVNSDNKNWTSYWQPHDDSNIGTAILTDAHTFAGSETYLSDTKDLSNAYTQLKVKNNKVIYYAGFGWEKSKQFANNQEWEKYLSDFSLKLENPLKIQIIQ